MGFNFKNIFKLNDDLPLIYFRHGVFMRSLYFKRIFDCTSHLQGDIIECGVGTGFGLCTWASIARNANHDRKIVAVDSFSGFSKFSDKDGKHINEKIYTKNYRRYNIEYVKSHLRTFGITNEEINDIEFIKGYVPQVFNDVPITRKISILNLDFDLYEPVKSAFIELYDLVEKGGVIMFDEYDKDRDLIKWPGSYVAVNEAIDFLGLKTSMIKKDIPSGYSFLVKE